MAGVFWWALLAASPARGGFAGTQGLRRPTRSWETRRASRSPSSISVCCRMWRLHSPWVGNARGRSAGGGVSLGHDPTAVGMGTGQVRGCSQWNPTLSRTARPIGPLPPFGQASQPCFRQNLLAPTATHPSTRFHLLPKEKKNALLHLPCRCPSRLSPDRLALSSSRLGRYGGA